MVPDRSLVTAPAAIEALEGILAAGRHAKRFRNLEIAAARVLAIVLRLYAEQGVPPSPAKIAEGSGLSESETSRLLTELFRRDLVLQGEDALSISGAYPFTQSATGHSVTFVRTGRSLNTICVIDALGAGAMCREDAIVRSVCQECGAPVVAEVADRGASLQGVQPAEAIVWAGFRPSSGSAAISVCKELLAFCSAQHLEQWKASRPHSDGRKLTIEEALQVGRAFFADRALRGRA